MTQVDTLQLIRDFLAQRLDVPAERVVADAQLADLGVDSLMFAEMLFDFEDRTQQTLDIQSADALPNTVGELQALIASHLEQQAAPQRNADHTG